MNINRDNYELWFLDYLEGNLDEKLINDFLEFIRDNPDLSEELQLFDTVSLPESNLEYPHKSKLYKQTLDLPAVFDSMAIGFLEGDLDQKEKISFEHFMQKHPEKNKELELFRLTLLSPDTSVCLKNKQRLYHQPVIRLMTSRLLRIAAVFIFLFAFSQVMEKPTEKTVPDSFLTIFTADNTATINPVKIEQSISNSAPEEFVSELNTPGNMEGKNYLKEKNVELSASYEFQSSVESVREYSSSLLSVAYSSPAYEIQTTEPVLAIPSIDHGIAALDETVNGSLSHKLFRKIGITGINPGKLVRWGLSLATGLTKEKFNYSTDASGDIIALNLDTRLVGFSIPVNRK